MNPLTTWAALITGALRGTGAYSSHSCVKSLAGIMRFKTSRNCIACTVELLND